jgi:hypothetical protein
MAAFFISGSLAKSVGVFWFRQSAKGMIQGDFRAMKCPKTAGQSHLTPIDNAQYFDEISVIPPCF